MNSLAEKWSKLKHFNSWQWSVLLGSEFILPLTWLRLRSRGYIKSLEWVSPSSTTRSGLDFEAELALARQTAFAVDVACKYGLYKPKCLVRSLALGWFLGRRGIPFEVRIGVPQGQPLMGKGGKLDFTAHAWVEFDGVVLNDKEDVAKDYKPFDSGSGFSRDDQENGEDLGNRG